MTSTKKNFLYQVSYELLIILLPFVTSPYISRVLGVDGLGITSYTYSIVSYFVLFANLGIKNYGNRVIAQVRGNREQLNKTYSSLLIIHMLFSFLVIISYFIWIYFTFENHRLVYFIQGIHIFAALLDINWFFFGIEKFKLTVSRNTIIKIITTISVFLFVRNQNDVIIYAAIVAIGTLLGQSFVWLFVGRYVSYVKTSWKQKKEHIKPLLILFIPTISISLYKILGKIMLGYMTNVGEVAYYENADKISNLPMVIIASLGIVMLPKMSNVLSNNRNNDLAKKYIKISIEFVLFLAFAFAFGLAAISEDFAPVFWGEKFLFSGILIKYMAITIPFMSFANVIRTQFLLPLAKDKEYTISVVSGAIINIIANLILIPKFGAIGCVISIIIAEVVVSIAQGVSVRNQLPIIEYLISAIPYFINGLVMYILLSFIDYEGNLIVSLILKVLLGIIYYLVSNYIVIRLFKPHILESISFFRKK